MQVTINDKSQKLKENSSVSDALKAIEIERAMNIAVAVNFSVVSKEEWDNFKLNENDKIMIIRATQGG